MTPTALAPAPGRATTTITIAWGLLTIPVSVYTGTEETRVTRKEFFHGDAAVPVGRRPVRTDTGETIEQDDVVRMACASTGAWVALTDDDIAICTSERGLAEVICFVKNTKVGQYLVKDIKQVRPKKDKGKVNPATNKAFGLLLTAMKVQKVCALIKVAMRGPAQYALLDCDGNLFLVYTADQVRAAAEHTHSDTFTEAELAMASQLIEAVGVDAPVLFDTTAPVVAAFVENKALGIEPVKTIEIAPQGGDVMAQLLASIDAVKAVK